MLSERRAYTDNASRCVEPTQPCKTLLLKHRPAVLNPLLPETANSTQLFFCSLLSSGSSAVPVIKPAGDLVLISSKSQGLFSTEDLQGHLFSIPIPAGTPPPPAPARGLYSHTTTVTLSTIATRWHPFPHSCTSRVVLPEATQDPEFKR